MADRGLNGNSSLAYRGVRPATPPNLVMHPRAPLTTDYKEFCIGDIWINNSGRQLTPPVYPGPGDVYMLTSVARNIATWIPMVGGLMSLEGDLGLPVFGDATQNIELTSTIPNFDITGFPVLHEIVFSSTGGGSFAEMFETDDANVVVPNNAGLVFVAGAGGITTTGAGNVITIHDAAAPVETTYTTDAGNATPAANILNVLGGHDLNTVGAGNTVTVNVDNAITLGDLAPLAVGVPALTLTTGDINFLGDIQNPVTVQRIVWPANNSISFFLNNIFMGQDAGNLTMTPAVAIFNIGIGPYACAGLTTGAQNLAIGNGALQACTTGQNNHIYGYVAGGRITTGSGNIAIGSSALNTVATGLTTGSNNIAIGQQAGKNYTGAESTNILIGQLDGVVGESNVTKIAGVRGVTTNVADAIPVLIDSAHQLGTISSSIRYKDNVEDMGDSSDNILNLRPVTFEYKKHPGVKQYGLIAEEVAEHMPRLVVYDQDGLPETVKYHELPAILLNEMQKLIKRIDLLEKNLQRYEEL